MDYRIDKTKIMEERGLNFLKAIGFSISANNLNSNDIDYKLKKDKKKNTEDNYAFVDFQYSSDFVKYGDIRVDLISAAEAISNTKETISKIKNKMEKKENLKDILTEEMKVKKYGKLFDERLNSIIFFIYNKADKKIEDDDIPDIIAIIPRKTILKFLQKHSDSLSDKIRINDKSKVGDNFSSAFLTIPFSALVASTKDIFLMYPGDIKNAFVAGM